MLCDCLLVEQGGGKAGQLTAHDVEIRERMVGEAMKKKWLEEKNHWIKPHSLCCPISSKYTAVKGVCLRVVSTRFRVD